MAELSQTYVFLKHQPVDREQGAVENKLETGERTIEEYTRQWEAAERWARRFIVGQQMFTVRENTLVIDDEFNNEGNE